MKLGKTRSQLTQGENASRAGEVEVARHTPSALAPSPGGFFFWLGSLIFLTLYDHVFRIS
jgi:hypothetical protein